MSLGTLEENVVLRQMDSLGSVLKHISIFLKSEILKFIAALFIFIIHLYNKDFFIIILYALQIQFKPFFSLLEETVKSIIIDTECKIPPL